MKNIIRKILKEETSTNSKEKEYKSIITYLTRKGLTPKTSRNKILNVLVDELGYESNEAIEVYFIFLHNYTKSANYSDVDISKTPKYDRYSKKLKTANYTARDLVKAKIPFQGSNTSAEWVGNVYVVSSYGWYPIFVYKNGRWFENSKRYSMSTGKQMSQLRPDNDTTKMTRDELNDLINR